MTKPRRRGNWTYDSTCGWRLNGTDLILDYDATHTGCAVPGAWLLGSDKVQPYEPIDHYLDAAMEWVEANRGRLPAAVV